MITKGNPQEAKRNPKQKPPGCLQGKPSSEGFDGSLENCKSGSLKVPSPNQKQDVTSNRNHQNAQWAKPTPGV
jgi:hypothetical protein